MEKLKETEPSPETKQLIVNKLNATSYLESVKGIIAVLSAVILYTASATCVQLLEKANSRFRIKHLSMWNSSNILLNRINNDAKMADLIDRSEIGSTLLYSLAASSSKMGEFVAVTFLPAAAVSCLYSTSTIIFGLLLFSLLVEG